MFFIVVQLGRTFSRQIEKRDECFQAISIPQKHPIFSTRHKWKAVRHCLAEDEAVSRSVMAGKSRKVGNSADANLLPSTEQWRFLVAFSFLAIVRLHFALSNSYIHPDEHFQGPEVVVGTTHSYITANMLAGDVFGWQASLPWEFTNNNPVNSPIRSILPIWMVYGLPMRFIKQLYGCKYAHLFLLRPQ